MLQIRRMLQLLGTGKRATKVAQELDISVNTVKRYQQIFTESGRSMTELQSLEDERLQELVYRSKTVRQNQSRAGVLTTLLPDYVHRLETTHSTRELLWAEYKQKHTDGYSYSQFCEYLSHYLLHTQAVMHLDHKPGDVLQIDFAGDKLFYTDKSNGVRVACPVLVCVLPFSNFCYAEALPNMSQRLLIDALNRCLNYLGGVPYNMCTDNMKQLVTKAHKYEPTFSELIDQFALHYNLSVTATRVRKPRDKASVERHVGIVYSRIYALIEQEQYYSLTELNAAITRHLQALNDAPMQRKTHSRRACFTLFELPLLRPLPAEIFEIKCRTQGKVKRDYHVILGEDWHNYSVPYQYIGQKVTLLYDSRNVEIYCNHKRIALHLRSFIKNGYTTTDPHRPEAHKITNLIRQYKPQDFIEKAALVGESTRKVIEQIIGTSFFSDQLFKSCLGILRLGKAYGNERLENACRMALSGWVLNYGTIKKILDNNRDKRLETPQAPVVTNIMHDNVRGSEFFAQFGDISKPDKPFKIE